MDKSRLIAVFSTLNAAEKAGLRKFVASPYHNSRQDVVDLLDYLLRYQHRDKALQKAVVFPLLFPNSSVYDDFKLRQAMTFLLRLIEQFLMIEQLKRDKVRQQIGLAQLYRERKLGPLFHKTMNKAEQLLTRSDLRNVQFLDWDYQIQSEYYAFASEENRVVPLNLQKMNDLLDLRFVAEKLRRTCLALAHGNVFKSDYEIEWLEEVVDFVERKNLLDHPLIAIYYYTYRSLTDDNPHYFQQLKSQLLKHLDQFPKAELHDLFILAINYCIKRINNNEEAFVRESFDLYQKGLAYELFVQNGYLSRFTYKNIVAAGLKLGEYQTVEQFINQYKDQLAPKFREGNYSYNLALLYFSRKEYKAAMQLLLQVEYDDLFLNLDSKNMLMKMYFELGEHDALESLLESMRTYLVRKKVIGYHKTNYRNIIRLTRKLLQVNPFSKAQLKKLRREIETSQPLTERNWLLTQLALLNRNRQNS